MLTSDFKYMANNAEADAEDFLTSPLHLGEALSQPRVAFTLLGAGAALGGAFALDETIRARIHKMSDGDALRLEQVGTYTLAGGEGLLYFYGLLSNKPDAREYALTGGEGAAIATLVTLGIKEAFGRDRPRQHKGAFKFFDGGASFVSGETTPAFAFATALSEYGENRWYVAIPAYSLAMTVGLGRMGHDAHWFSDVVGAAIVGSGITEVLIHWHRQHQADPGRFRIFPVMSPHGGGLGVEGSF